jgi:hypothetical protein
MQRRAACFLPERSEAFRQQIRQPAPRGAAFQDKTALRHCFVAFLGQINILHLRRAQDARRPMDSKQISKLIKRGRRWQKSRAEGESKASFCGDCPEMWRLIAACVKIYRLMATAKCGRFAMRAGNASLDNYRGKLYTSLVSFVAEFCALFAVRREAAAKVRAAGDFALKKNGLLCCNSHIRRR